MLSSFGTGDCVDHHIDLFFCSSITIFDYWIFLSFTGMSRISAVSGVSIHQSIPCLLHKDIKASYIEVLSPSQMFFVKFLSSSFLLPFHVFRLCHYHLCHPCHPQLCHPWGKSPQNGTERVSVTSAKTFFFP